MRDPLEASIPVLRFRFTNERYSVFFPFWEWKLNTFSNEFSRPNLPLLNIRFVSASETGPFYEEKKLYSSSRNGFLSDQIYRLPGNKLLFSMENVEKKLVFLEYLFDPESLELTLLEDATDTNGCAAIEYMLQVLPGLLIRQHSFIIHGVLLEHEGRGIMLTAPSGVGKTTHAHLWRANKHAIILNGDLSACYQKQTDKGPVWTGFGTPWCGTSGEYINREVPITAVVALEQNVRNEATRLEGLAALEAVYPQLKLPIWDKGLAGAGVDLLMEMLEKVPVFRLRCRPDVDAVETLDRALREL